MLPLCLQYDPWSYNERYILLCCCNGHEPDLRVSNARKGNYSPPKSTADRCLARSNVAFPPRHKMYINDERIKTKGIADRAAMRSSITGAPSLRLWGAVCVTDSTKRGWSSIRFPSVGNDNATAPVASIGSAWAFRYPRYRAVESWSKKPLKAGVAAEDGGQAS